MQGAYMQILTPREAQLEIENIRLRNENAKLRADLDYISLMTDVEIPQKEANNNELVSEG
mgnify:FL=1